MFSGYFVQLLPIVLALASVGQSQTAGCNGAAALECCTTVVPSTDPAAQLAFTLGGITPPTTTTQVGLLCIPATSLTGEICLTNLVACDDNSHLGTAIGCNLKLQTA
ncbi:hypothetical protein QCA50_018245 [Cerrena zonata]|uniref:Hydrophobin n=1 Tax=Cerrena zonata TaxID=2478898 RepID=A0AAW0FI63_9APHY